MKWQVIFFMVHCITTMSSSAMEPHIIILDETTYENGPDKRFCCPYCFKKFILKQLFHDHLLTHPEAVALGPIPGHTPYLGIYSTQQELEQKLAALHKAFVAAGLLPQ